MPRGVQSSQRTTAGTPERWRCHAPQTVQAMTHRVRSAGGFGARGFAHAPLLAEALASDLCGEPSPLERAGREALHPARFAWRALKKSS